jgi:hypothetical protein
MNRKTNKVIILWILLIAVSLAACGIAAKRLGWTCMNSLNELDCKYQLFTGQEVEGISLKKGESLEITADVQVEDGELMVNIQNPDGDFIWDPDFPGTSSDTFKFQAAEGGLYRLIVEGIETRGSFNINWQVLE